MFPSVIGRIGSLKRAIALDYNACRIRQAQSPRRRVGSLAGERPSGLATGMHVDMLHGYLLLALAAMPVQSVEQHDIGSGQLVGLVQVLTSAVGVCSGSIARR
jgi:hypothetical protein